MPSCNFIKFVSKNGITCNILKNYVENRDLILDSFSIDRKEVKEMLLTILNGGFKNLYSDDNRINNYLKLLEKVIVEIQKYFHTKDKRYFEKDFNLKGKNLSRIILDIENQISQIMINYFFIEIFVIIKIQ